MKILKIVVLIFTVVIGTAFSLRDVNKGYEIGDVIEDFSLKNVNGSMMSLSDLGNVKGAIVVFTCNYCPYSKMYENRIIALDKKYKQMGYPIVAINPNDPEASLGDDFESMQQRAAVKEFTFPYLFDEGQNVYPKFGATKTPHVFILKKEYKEFVLKYIGAIDDNARNEANVKVRYVANAVNDLLAGNELEVTKTKAIGCSVKVMR